MTIRKRNIVSISTYGSQTYLPEGVFYDNEYDHNGNLLYDEMRETKFRYNHLNLATTITSPDDTLLIQYDAIGNKVRQISKTSTSVDTVYFVGGSIFSSPPAPLSPLWGQGAGEGGSTYKLSYLPLSEGYYSDGEYFAVIHDYLGSVRVVLSVDSNRVKEVNHYGPRGVEYGLSDSPFGIQPFKHQGKERLGVAGFSLHNHGARLADNVMGRWTTRDPLEERDYWNGAYVYCGNNPVRYVDPDGRYFDKANENKASKIEKKA
jgi:RHS repeat-associated protein